MSYLSEVELAVKTILKYNKDLVLLQCTANYPIEDHEANLNVLRTFREKFDVLLGFSDHTIGIGAAPYAIPMGAVIVEKHFTLSKVDEGPDHRASLAPDELIEFVKEVKKVDRFMGSLVKMPTLSESQTRSSLQKCVVAKKIINEGEAFSNKNITSKRTGGAGISALYESELYGITAGRVFQKNDVIIL
jgi:sialic acid synthase SpsE